MCCWGGLAGSLRNAGCVVAGRRTARQTTETDEVPHEESVVRTGEIKALSGLRIVAAVWVVLFHFRPLLEQAAPGFRSALAPILDCGAQGVDLFFILSGYLIYGTLLRRAPAFLPFMARRVQRIYPAFLCVFAPLAALH